MTTILGVGFTAPWLLAALLLLPLIWLLLRLTPTRPLQVAFPPTRLLFDLIPKEETPARSPWWQTLMRLLAAAAIILALAGAIWRPVTDTLVQPGPLWVIVDNSWAAAPDWPERAAAVERVIHQADSSDRPILLIATADAPNQTAGEVAPSLARERSAAIEPKPWHADRMAFEAFLTERAAENPPARIHWLTDGVTELAGEDFAATLAALAPDAEIIAYEAASGGPYAITQARNDADAIAVEVARLNTGTERQVTLQALDLRRNLIGEAPVTFNADETATDVLIELPLELRNEVAQLELVGERSAGSVFLVDDQWQRRRIGIVSGTSSDVDQPLLSPEYYIRRAISPYATLIEPGSDTVPETIDQFIEAGVSLMFLADVGTLPLPASEALETWIGQGGTMVRFALAGLDQATDGLLPVGLRSGARDLGGTLAWSEPQPLGPFLETGPFNDLSVPDDIFVTRQVLAEPEAGLLEKTWAQLDDGTPLVTGERLGAGWLVLFHVPADTEWSNLPLSGTFVAMLDRLVQMSRAAGVTTSAPASDFSSEAVETLPPLRLLDGYGQFGARHVDAEPLPVSTPATQMANRIAPPGLYGTESGFRAVNVLSPEANVAALDLSSASNVTLRGYERASERPLAGLLFTVALVILLVDALVVLWMSGAFTRRSFTTRTAQTVLMSIGLATTMLVVDARAQDDETAIFAVSETRLAYVLTGNPELDRISERGLYGLSQFLTLKTALEPGEPMAVDVASDELVFFPLLYWPIDPSAPLPEAETIARIDTYMKNGGTILFDTRDSIDGIGFSNSGSPAGDWLRDMLQTIDVPPLEPVPIDHVLTKTFYLMDEFPGRYPDGPMWIEALDASVQEGRPVRASDGVSPLLITGNDLAGAWAIDDERRAILPVVPNDSFQRELAYRVGVNIVMYVLTGNYKADQVHVPALLERLGQ